MKWGQPDGRVKVFKYRGAWVWFMCDLIGRDYGNFIMFTSWRTAMDDANMWISRGFR